MADDLSSTSDPPSQSESGSESTDSSLRGDRNNDGTVSMDELQQAVDDFASSDSSTSSEDLQQIESNFEPQWPWMQGDQNDDGKISRSEVSRINQQYSQGAVSETVVRAVNEKYDDRVSPPSSDEDGDLAPTSEAIEYLKNRGTLTDLYPMREIRGFDREAYSDSYRGLRHGAGIQPDSIKGIFFRGGGYEDLDAEQQFRFRSNVLQSEPWAYGSTDAAKEQSEEFARDLENLPERNDLVTERYTEGDTAQEPTAAAARRMQQDQTSAAAKSDDVSGGSSEQPASTDAGLALAGRSAPESADPDAMSQPLIATRQQIEDDGVNVPGSSGSEWTRDPENFTLDYDAGSVDVYLSEEGQSRLDGGLTDRSDASGATPSTSPNADAGTQQRQSTSPADRVQTWAEEQGLSDYSATREFDGGWQVSYQEDGTEKTTNLALTQQAEQQFEERQRQQLLEAGEEQLESGLAAADEPITQTAPGLEVTQTQTRTQRSEQFGDVDWSAGMGDPSEDEVENAIDSAAQNWQNELDRAAETVSDSKLAAPGGVTAALATGGGGATGALAANDTGPARGFEGAVNSAAQLLNLPGAVSGGLEAAETAAYVGGPAVQSVGEAQAGQFDEAAASRSTAGERAEQTIAAGAEMAREGAEWIQTNPQRAYGSGLVALGAFAAGSAAETAAVSRVPALEKIPDGGSTAVKAARASRKTGRRLRAQVSNSDLSSALRSNDGSSGAIETYSTEIDDTLSRQGPPSDRARFGESGNEGLESGESLFGDSDPYDTVGNEYDVETITPSSSEEPKNPGPTEPTGTGGTGPLLDADSVDDAAGVSGPSQLNLARGRARREVVAPLSERAQDIRDRAVDEFTGTSRGQAELVPGRQTTEETSGSGASDFSDFGSQGPEIDPSRDELLSGSPRDRMSDDIASRSLTQRQQNAGEYDGVSDPVGEAETLRRRAERREARLFDNDDRSRVRMDAESRSFDRIGLGSLLGAGSAFGLDQERGSETGLSSDFGQLINPATGSDTLAGQLIDPATGSDTLAGADTDSRTWTDIDQRTRTETDQRTDWRTRFDFDFDFSGRRRTPDGGEEQRDGERTRSFGFDLSGSDGSPDELSRGAGWLNEFVVAQALGAGPREAADQETLEEAAASGWGGLTGQLPTQVEVSGTQQQQEEIAEQRDFFTFDGGEGGLGL